MKIIAKEGDSPVINNFKFFFNKIKKNKTLSKTKTVIFCLNIGGPPSKSKYISITDSELVP